MSAQAAMRLGRSGTTTLALRDYQRACLDAIYAARERGVTRQLTSLPTGAGKTIVAAHLVSEAVATAGASGRFELGGRVVFMVHRDELARQTVEKMRLVNPSLSIGIVKADRDELDAELVVVSAQTIAHETRLARLLRAVGPGCLFISDECHHDRAASRMRAIETMAPGLLVGLTATPMRGDKLGLDAIYQEIVYHLPMRTLVERNHLARPVGIRIETEADLDSVHTVAGEFNEGELERTVDTEARNRIIVESWQKHASDRKATIVFCVTVAHAERVRDAFRAAGVAAEMVDGSTPVAERQRLFRDFHDGKIRVLTNCMVLTEGFDESVIDCAIMARPTKSQGLYIQCVGRALRPWAGKPDALIIDVVDLTTRHQLVTLPVLSGIEPGQDGEHPLSESVRSAGQVMDLFDTMAHHGRLRERDAIMIDLLAESPFVWQRMPDGQFMAPAEYGWVTIIPENDGYIPVSVQGGQYYEAPALERLFEQPVDAETAMAIAQARIPGGALTQRDAHWRTAPASERQLIAAKKWRVDVPRGAKRGQVSDLISIAAFRATMRRLGIGGKV